jgi:hypothetical protein
MALTSSSIFCGIDRGSPHVVIQAVFRKVVILCERITVFAQGPIIFGQRFLGGPSWGKKSPP